VSAVKIYKWLRVQGEKRLNLTHVTAAEWRDKCKSSGHNKPELTRELFLERDEREDKKLRGPYSGIFGIFVCPDSSQILFVPT
jgi:hypothetical protein